MRLERAIDVAVQAMLEKLREVIAGLQSLRGVEKISAVTLVAELGQISRFDHARQLMGYAGSSRASIPAPRVCAAARSARRATRTCDVS